MQHLYRFAKSFLGLACLVLFLSTGAASAQTTSFTYQGRLTDGGAPANGNYEMQFKLFDTPGNQTGPTLTFDGAGSNPAAVTVTNGVFTVQLDFGAGAFPGGDRYLELSFRRPGETSFTPLSPRQPLSPTPYAVRSLSAAAADVATDAQRLGGVAAGQYVQTGDSRLADARPPTAGSSAYIQNRTTTQAGTSFNISDNGTAGGTLSGNTVNATTQYNIGGVRVLRAAGTNLFAGIGAGQNNSGNNNNNSFFGANAGISNAYGLINSFFGAGAGASNTNGHSNSFFGSAAGQNNSTSFNSFFGESSGRNNTEGSWNSFFGASAGLSNTTGRHNTLIGGNADVVGSNLQQATAIGANSRVSSSFTVVLGTGDDTVQVPGKITVATLGTIGLTPVCRNFSNEISNCSSSLRYKTNIAPFSSGLNLVSRLRPITFDWKTGGVRDVGFGAEEVAALNPLFVNYNSKGQVEGVKYDRLSVAFVNAFKEQQAQIEQQRAQIDALRKLVCLDHPHAHVCK